jgi:hypothetical protein
MQRERHSPQKDLNILAALSLSLSSVVGQNASLPMRFDSRLMGAPSLSAHPHTLSNPFLLWVLVVAHDGSLDLTFSILKMEMKDDARCNPGTSSMG